MNENENVEKFFISTQLVCMLNCESLKVLMYIYGWKTQEWVKYYPKQWSKFLHMEESEIERAIQTLIDRKIITISNDGNVFMFRPNGKEIMKYVNVKLQSLHDVEGFKLAEVVTWNQTKIVENKKTMDDLSEQEISALILRLQASLNEKKQVRKIVQNNNEDLLPF